MHVPISILLLWGCSDPDGDGLYSGRERGLGTDPRLADSDGDRLPDGDELIQGTDPLVYDSDGDGYADGDEITEGTDPLDPESRIYVGGWPYAWNKDTLVDPGFDQPLVAGVQLPRLITRDAFGDDVDLYDYAFQGVPIFIETCIYNPGNYCWNFASFRNRGDEALRFSEWRVLRRAVEDGRLLWITVLSARTSVDLPPATLEEVTDWGTRFPDAAALWDPDRAFADWLSQDITTGVRPAMAWVDEDLRVHRLARDSDPYNLYPMYRLASFLEELEAQD